MKITNIDEIKQKAIPVLKKAGAVRASLFGSVVRGKAGRDSDIDILVDLPRGTGLFAFVNLQCKLEKALKTKVDLVTYNSLHPLLRDRILKEQKPIF